MQGGGKSFSSVTRHEKFQLTRNCTNMTAFSCSFSALKGAGGQAAEMREHLTVLEPKRRKLPLQNSKQLKLMKILAPSHSHMKWSHKNELGTVMKLWIRPKCYNVKIWEKTPSRAITRLAKLFQYLLLVVLEQEVSLDYSG